MTEKFKLEHAYMGKILNPDHAQLGKTILQRHSKSTTVYTHPPESFMEPLVHCADCACAEPQPNPRLDKHIHILK